MIMNIETIILGAGPSSLQLAYFLKQNNIPYLIIERNTTCASFFSKYPHTKKLISLNKKYTGKSDPEFNLRHDWNSLLNDDNFLFTDFSDELYPNSNELHNYLNSFYKKYELNINFNQEIISVKKCSNDYLYEISVKNSDQEVITYKCNKLIVATGLSQAVYPELQLETQIHYENNEKIIKHYNDYPSGYFMDKENLKNYINKKVLIIGGGNSAYELANLLQSYCSHIILLGSNKNLSIVTHYVGDIRTIYLPFLDTFYLKSLNGIDNVDKDTLKTYKIYQNSDNYSANYKKFKLVNSIGEHYYHNTPDLEYFDEIIYCTGWKFDTGIFNFDVKLTPNNKYPEVNYNFESTNNKNMFFIGSLMHSKDFKKGSGGFIHGFRYLIKLFTQLNYSIPFSIKTFLFTGNMDCYNELTEYIYKRINYSSSLYQMYGTLCDIFYFDKTEKSIKYIEDVKLDCLQALKINQNSTNNPIKHINVLILEYGQEVQNIKQLGAFNKFNPAFLHPKIYIYELSGSPLTLLDRITFEEDLVADFKSKVTYHKIKQTLKMCNLII
jgi:thioredoxin reductase